jgi:hypothetical protein
MHDEREQAELIKRQRDANKAYGMSASNGMGDETESQVEAVWFTESNDNGKTDITIMDSTVPVVKESSHDGEHWFGFDSYARYQRIRYVNPEDEVQAKFLLEEGKWQERTEKAFCWGMMVGGAVALGVYNLTLWLVGLL